MRFFIINYQMKMAQHTLGFITIYAGKYFFTELLLMFSYVKVRINLQNYKRVMEVFIRNKPGSF